MLSSDSASEIGKLGLLSKESLDQLYVQVAGEAADEDEIKKDTIAQQLAEAIARDPNVADVAQRVQTYAALPQPAATPAPVAVPAPGVNNAAALPAQTPVPEPVTPRRSDQMESALSTIQNAQANVANGAPAQDALSRVMSGIEMQKAGVIADAANARTEAAQTSALYSRAITDLEKTANETQAKLAKIEAIRDDQLAKQVAAVDEANKAEIDPNHFWGSRNTTQKIAAGIGIMFSAMGGGDKAFRVIDDAIKNDIDTQKANFDLKLRGLDARNNLLSQAHAITGDVESAAKLATAMQIQQVQFRVNQAAGAVGGAKANAEMLKALGKLEEEKGKLMAEVQKKAGLQISSESVNPTIGIPVLPENFSGLGLPDEYRKGFISGLGIARDADTADRLSKASSSFDGLNRDLARLRELRVENGAEDVDSQARSKGQALWFSILQKIRSLESLGALDQGTVDVFSEAIPKDPLGAGFHVLGIGVPGSGTAQRVGNAIMGDRLTAKIDEVKNDLTASYYDKVKKDLIAIDPKVALKLAGQVGLEGHTRARGSAPRG